ncbi:MAG TPA: methyltransferase domain-containing protein [Gaiellales bacterium]|jgi:SAM-dependent methyltransferase
MFTVAADAYDRFMGRYSVPLAPPFAAFAGVRPGWSVLDVGAGPGALTGVLAGMVGAAGVTAVDPSEPFVAANRERHPGVRVLAASAERLPFEDAAFDAALAQLVVHFMADPGGGVAEMARVTRPGGVVAACVWDFERGRAPLSAFWDAAQAVDTESPGEGGRVGVRSGQLASLFRAAGLAGIEEAEIGVTVEHESFDAWWQPMTLGVGPAGSWLVSRPQAVQDAIRDRLRAAYPGAPGIRTAVVWAARGVAGGGS